MVHVNYHSNKVRTAPSAINITCSAFFSCYHRLASLSLLMFFFHAAPSSHSKQFERMLAIVDKYINGKANALDRFTLNS